MAIVVVVGGRRHWCDGESLSSAVGIMCIINVACPNGPLACHVKHGGAVGMDNMMRYDGVLVYESSPSFRLESQVSKRVSVVGLCASVERQSKLRNGGRQI